MRENKSIFKPLKLTQHTEQEEDDQFCIRNIGSPRRVYSPRPRNPVSGISQVNDLAVSPNNKYSVHK